MKVWKYFNSQKQWEVFLKDLLKTNDKALFKSILLIYNNQTTEEQQKQESIDDNYIGFSKIDAKEMSLIAKKIKNKEQLTKGEIAKSRNKMCKYWKQLMHISLEKQKKNKENLYKEYELEMFKANMEEIKQCYENGKQCKFGICSECVLNNGIQLRL